MPYKDPEANRASKSQWDKEQKQIIRLLKQSPDGTNPLWVEGQRRILIAQKNAERMWNRFADPDRKSDAERSRERQRRYMERQGEAGREKARERTRLNYQENKEERQAYAREYHIAHREENNAKSAAYHAANAPKIRVRKRVYRQANAEKISIRYSQYQAEHPEAIRMYASARRARKKGLPDTFTATERQFMLDYWHHACAICGNEEGFFWTLADDHWIPITSPDCPGTVADNMIPLCHGDGGCNNSKWATDPQAWLISRFGMTKAKRILKAIETYFAIVRARQAPKAS